MKVKQLSELEQEAMNIVWECKECSIREIRARLKKRLAYTTVATILQRLDDKGFVSRKESGIFLIYSAKVTKERYIKNLAKSFVGKFFNSFGDTAMASFVDSLDNLPKKKRDYLLRLLGESNENK